VQPVVVLITLSNLRADAVEPTGGPPGSSPAFSALADRAGTGGFVGPAVAGSSSSLPALASLLTGLAPSRHGVASWELAELGGNLPSLPAQLAAAGVPTSGWVDGALFAAPGWNRGFSSWREVGRLRVVREALATPPAGPSFSWIHLPGARPGWQRRHAVPAGLLELALLPPRLGRDELAEIGRGGDFARQGALVRSMYRSAVWHADSELAMLLATLEQSPRWAQTLVVVTSDAGFLLGEGGKIGNGHGLLPAEVEVPLVVRLPPRLALALPQSGERVAATGVAATVLEAFGLAVPPGIDPPLGRGGRRPLVCELPVSAGTRAMVAVVGNAAVWRSERFAAVEPDAGPADPLAPGSLRSRAEIESYRNTQPWLEWSQRVGSWSGDEPADPSAVERAQVQLDRLVASAVRPSDTARMAGVSAPLRYTEQASPVEAPGP
jgi:hypothetical protein